MSFDPDTFLSQTIEGALDTKITPCPPGEYPAVITSIKPRVQRSQEGTEYLIFDVMWRVEDPAVTKAVGRDSVSVRQSIFIDRTPNGSLDTAKGRNVQLGRLREAVKQNGPGPWAPSMLVGQAARIKVALETDTRAGEVYARVQAVTKL